MFNPIDFQVWINLGPLLYHFADTYGHEDVRFLSESDIYDSFDCCIAFMVPLNIYFCLLVGNVD